MLEELQMSREQVEKKSLNVPKCSWQQKTQYFEKDAAGGTCHAVARQTCRVQGDPFSILIRAPLTTESRKNPFYRN